jgi:MYXO-CTERM domain-containing protein
LSKEFDIVKRNQQIGGVFLLIAGALTMLFLESDASVPIGAALMVAGIALIAAGRRRSREAQ